MGRTKNASKNVIAGFINQALGMLAPFIVRTFMIMYLGAEYVGLGSLFTSILNVLNLAELGVSTAIVYSLYSAIATGNKKTICALLGFFRKAYYIAGTVVLVLGLGVSPFLKYLIANGYPASINLYILFYIFLANTLLTYFVFSYRSSVFIAHQRNDVVSNVGSLTKLLMNVCQLLAIILFKNYYIYAVFLPLTTLLSNLIIFFLSKKKYPDYYPSGDLEKEEKSAVYKKIKSLFLYRVGSVVLMSVDGIVISAFLGLRMLGIYNNYYYIISVLFGFIQVFFASLTSGIGNSVVVESKEKNYRDFRKIFLVHGWIIGFCTVCLLCLYQPFIALWVGEDMLLDVGLTLCFAVYFYVWKMMEVVNVYKDATGMWEFDKFRPLVAAAVNLALNLCLVHFIGLYGILLSTIVAIVIIIFPWSTSVLFKHYFFDIGGHPLRRYLLSYGYMTLVTFFAAASTFFLCETIPQITIWGLLLKALICVAVPNVFFLFFYSFLSDFTLTVEWFRDKVKNALSRRKK